MCEIKCDECGQNYLVSELWLVDNRGNKLYCDRCKKETTFTIIKGLTYVSAGFLAISKVRTKGKK